MELTAPLPLIQRYDMLPRGCRVLCAVSGGGDSMCLLHWLSTRQGALGITVAAAHFNHCLRGGESDRDEALVRETCARWGIPLFVERGRVREFAAQGKYSLEEAGRILRYAFLERTAQAEGCGRIATAHNAGDNAETVLLHLIRGTGLQGLTGIPPRRDKLVRPLLTTSRAEIEAYLHRHALPYVQDSSNDDLTYTRNRVRHQLLPLLEEFNPRFLENLTGTIPRLRSDSELLDALAAQISAQAGAGPSGVIIPAGLIAQAPDAIAVRAVRQLLARTAGGDTDCSAAHLEALVGLCRGDAPSAQIHLPGGRIARRVYELLEITAAPEAGPIRPFTPEASEVPVPGTPWTARISPPPWPGLVIRARQTGDCITLPGRHSRSLKKLLIDRKIPRHDRDRIPVAADGDGVVAVAGLGPNTAHPGYPQATVLFKKTETEDG